MRDNRGVYMARLITDKYKEWEAEEITLVRGEWKCRI